MTNSSGQSQQTSQTNMTMVGTAISDACRETVLAQNLNIRCYHCGLLGDVAGTCTESTTIEGAALGANRSGTQLQLAGSDATTTLDANKMLTDEENCVYAFSNIH